MAKTTKRKALNPDKVTFQRMLGQRVKQLRRAAGWSQEQLAEQIGLSVHAVSAFERGVSFATLDTLLALAEALRVTLAQLIAGVAQETYPERIAKIASLLMEQDEDVVLAFETLALSLARRK